MQLSLLWALSSCLCMSFLCAGVGGQRATVGFVERRHKESIQERVRLTADWDVVKPGGAAAGPEPGGARCSIGPEGAAALLRAQRSLSPEGHRSSSVPPSAHRNIPATTPSMYLVQYFSASTM